MSNFTLRAALLLSAAAVVLTGSHAIAAEVPAAAAAATADDTGLADIVVTAERRSENLQKVPLSVGVVSGDLLRSFQSGGGDLLELSGRVPGLYAETTTGRIFPRFYIRGLGNIDFYLGASQPVEIIQDDVVLEHVVLKSNPAYDLAQVEVLRGPQGTLFGRNTTAGIIKIDTIKPSDDLTARASGSYGSYNTVTFDGGIGGAIIPGKIAVRVSGLYQHRDNWVDNTFTGVSADKTQVNKTDALGGFNERDLRAQILLTPTEDLTILAEGQGRSYKGTSTIFHRGALIKGSNTPVGPRDQVGLDEGAGNPQAYETYGAFLNVKYDFGPVSLTSISAYETLSGYSRGDTDGGAAANYPVNGVPNGFGESQGKVRGLNQYTEEVRLASNGQGRFKYQVGGMYFDSRDTTEFDQRAIFTGTNPNNYVVLRNINTSWAVFGQASYEIVPNLTLTAGARETNDTKSTTLLQTANTALNVVTYTGRRYVRLSSTQPSWDVSALYQIDPDVSVYARVARGFRGPTIQGRSAVFNSDFTTANSETIISYEAGFKSQLFDRKVRFNVTGFGYTVSNIQLNGNDSNGNGVLFNAAKANAYGVEAEAEWHPIEHLSLGLGASFLHTEIKDTRVYAQVCALNGVVVCTVNNPTIKIGTNVFAQINGNPLPDAPKYTVDATARYGVPVSKDAEVFIAGDVNLQGFTNFVLYKTNEFNSNGTYEAGLKAGYSTPKYEAAVFVRNLTDQKNLKGVIENYMAAVYNEPRIIGASLSFKLK
ncbi:TonB-dependent receptor [Glacieibacterium megasporae]|uniref:TonB-dependent receptor n=1 Tax=Glacieibacterium megasporae TaxID=2835787 RepID=UPI001C1DD3E7|nr:TonB-dependent receptor [Polymorphobacter megasporae]UAJ09142.1 TonB-dependent receptor [Polymorphobacter megasporae]